MQASPQLPGKLQSTPEYVHSKIEAAADGLSEGEESESGDESDDIVTTELSLSR